MRCAQPNPPDPQCLYLYARRRFRWSGSGGGELLLAADQHALVWLNGLFLGRTYLRSHDDEWRHERFDLAPHLRVGDNVVALLVHTWGQPEEAIPGVPPAVPLAFACMGRVGDEDLGDLATWRVAPAVAYRRAPRHNSLIGHEEDRDLRLEPQGWREPGFADDGWLPPVVGERARRFLPAPLGLLAEDDEFPARIVRQGRWTPGCAFLSEPPSPRHGWWRMTVEVGVVPPMFFHTTRVGSRLAIAGQEQDCAVTPPAGWVPVFRPLIVPAGRVVIAGWHPLGSGALALGWSVLPAGGQAVAWAEDTAGPYVPAASCRAERHLRPLTDTIADGPRSVLGADGALDLEVVDDEVAVVLEFPRSITMLPRLVVTDATAGASIELVYAERLSGVPGLLLPAAYTDRVTLRGGPQVHEVSFQYKSARIVVLVIRARGGRVRLGRVWATWRRHGYARTGSFASSEPRLDRVWEICRHTMECGSQDFIMDGPWREQLLYIGDNLVHNQACYHLFANHGIVEWQHRLYADGQMPDGIFSPNQPCRTPPQEYRLLDQTILWPIQLEHHLLYTGRREFIAGMLPRAVRLLDGFVASFARESADDPRLRGLTGWNWVDHPGHIGGRLRSIRHDGIPTAINLLHLLAIDATVRIAAWIAAAPLAAHLVPRAARLRELLLAEHWDAGRGVFADCRVDGAPSPELSIHVNLLAIRAGLARDPLALLDRTWRAADVQQISGPFFRLHLFDVLHQLGRVDDLLGELRTVWGGFIDDGLTTTPENEAINGDWGQSVGHPWSTAPAIHLVRAVAGLAPLTPGWVHTTFTPDLVDLERVAVTVPTPHGPLHARLERRGAGIVGELVVPAGITVVPGPSAAGVVVRVG